MQLNYRTSYGGKQESPELRDESFIILSPYTILRRGAFSQCPLLRVSVLEVGSVVDMCVCVSVYVILLLQCWQ